MTRTQRLAERAITFAIAEANEDLAVARLAFLAHGDHRSLRTRWEDGWVRGWRGSGCSVSSPSPSNRACGSPAQT